MTEMECLKTQLEEAQNKCAQLQNEYDKMQRDYQSIQSELEETLLKYDLAGMIDQKNGYPFVTLNIYEIDPREDDDDNNVDPSRWGSHLWNALHSIAAGYPDHPTEEEKLQFKTFFHLMQGILPCSKSVSYTHLRAHETHH